MKILVIDSYYPEVIKKLEVDRSLSYEQNLRRILDFSFGTGDAYTRNLKALGWDAVDVIANHDGLQELWLHETVSDRLVGSSSTIISMQIADCKPDVLFFQDLSLFRDPELDLWLCKLGKHFIAAQVSSPWPGDEQIKRCDVIFTSFPHYVSRIEALGVKAVYNPLAFEPSVLDRITERATRTIDCAFIGGVGAPSHWRYGMEVLNAVAEEIPTFHWWGYGAELLPDGPLKQKYHGEAWGLDMYNILLQSKIVLNRHGEVAEGFANNMRMYEATGCGALLVTESAPNLKDFFDNLECMTYDTPEEAVHKIRTGLAHWPLAKMTAAAGQHRTLRDHTYAQRMKIVSETLTEMLCPA